MHAPGDRRIQQPWVCTYDAEVLNRLLGALVSYEVVRHALNPLADPPILSHQLLMDSS